MDGATTIDRLARIGYVAKGALYFVMGALAVQLALGWGGRITGKEGALVTVLRQPFGRMLLLVVAVGLLGYAAWRVLQGVLDSERAGSNAKGIAVRAGSAIRGLVYGLVGWRALRLHRGLSAGDGNTERDLAAEAFQWPLGEWLVVLGGAGLMAYAVHQFYRAAAGRLERQLDLATMRREAGPWAVRLCRFGVMARAVIFTLIGWTLIRAGSSSNAAAVGTTETSLQTLASQPGAAGQWLFGLTAAGLVAYGIYEMLHARYLHIRPVR
jgi:hypothetical protein